MVKFPQKLRHTEFGETLPPMREVVQRLPQGTVPRHRKIAGISQHHRPIQFIGDKSGKKSVQRLNDIPASGTVPEQIIVVTEQFSGTGKIVAVAQ